MPLSRIATSLIEIMLDNCLGWLVHLKARLRDPDYPSYETAKILFEERRKPPMVDIVDPPVQSRSTLHPKPKKRYYPCPLCDFLEHLGYNCPHLAKARSCVKGNKKQKHPGEDDDEEDDSGFTAMLVLKAIATLLLLRSPHRLIPVF